MAAGVSESSSLRERLAGRWQTTALLGAIILLAGSGWYYRWPGRFPSASEQAAHLAMLIDSGNSSAARAQAEAFFDHWAYQDQSLAPIHYQLARAIANDAGLGSRGSARELAISNSALRKLVSTYLDAVEGGVELQPEDHLILGQAYRRLDQPITALDHIRRYIAASDNVPLDVHRSLVELMLASPNTSPDEIDRALRELEVEAEDHEAVRSWAFATRLDHLLSAGLLNPALEAVFAAGRDVTEEGIGTDLAYRQCRVIYSAGRYEEAEQRLRLLRSDLSPEEDLYAEAGWLLGTCIISGEAGQRPEQAGSLFEEVILRHPGDRLGGAAYLGLALAQYHLKEFDQSTKALEKAVGISLGLERGDWVLDADSVRGAGFMMSMGTRDVGEGSESLAYLQAIRPLVEAGNDAQHVQYLLTLGALEGDVADRLKLVLERSPPNAIGEAADEMERIRGHYVRAGDVMWKASEFSILQEDVSESAHWKAIDYYELGGKNRRAIDLLTRFVVGRTASSKLPEAMTRLGRVLQSSGRLESAIQVYQSCFRQFPRTIQGNRSLLLLAQCYLQGGPRYEQEAEDTLRLIVDNSEVFGPTSPEYAEALASLGELYSMTGEYERAIPVLEEALLRVGGQGDLLKLRFNLADAFRRVGLEIRSERANAQYIEDRERLKAREREALTRAAELYRRIFSQIAAGQEGVSRIDALLHRQSRQYYADCMYLMGRIEEALAYYQEIAWLHRDDIIALAAYVQIINCYLSLDSIHEARTAVRRAVQLTDTLEDEAFSETVHKESREQWRQFFSWIENSSLFEA